MENWKETSRNKDIDGNRRKTRKGRMTEQIRRQRKETERMGIAKRHTERGREQAGMSREGRRTMEKVLENTVRDTDYQSGFFIFDFRKPMKTDKNRTDKTG